MKACMPTMRAGSSPSVRSKAGSIATEASSVSLRAAGSFNKGRGATVRARTHSRESQNVHKQAANAAAQASSQPQASEHDSVGAHRHHTHVKGQDPSKEGTAEAELSQAVCAQASAARQQHHAKPVGSYAEACSVTQGHSSGQQLRSPEGTQPRPATACRTAQDATDANGALHSQTAHAAHKVELQMQSVLEQQDPHDKPKWVCTPAKASSSQIKAVDVKSAATSNLSAISNSPSTKHSSPAAATNSPTAAQCSPWSKSLGSKHAAARRGTAQALHTRGHGTAPTRSASTHQQVPPVSPRHLQQPQQPKSPVGTPSPATKRLAALQQQRAQSQQSRASARPALGPEVTSEEGLSNSAEQRALQASLAQLDSRLYNMAKCRGKSTGASFCSYCAGYVFKDPDRDHKTCVV